MNDQSFSGGRLNSPSLDQIRRELARRSRASRKHRLDAFGPLIARELPWDILLLLYVTDSRALLSVSSINEDVGAPMTTVLRYLRHLDDTGFVVRENHPTDRRIVYISLSPDGKCALDRFFDTTLSVNNAPL